MVRRLASGPVVGLVSATDPRTAALIAQHQRAQRPWNATDALHLYTAGYTVSAIARYYNLERSHCDQRLTNAIVRGWGVEKTNVTQRPCIRCRVMRPSEGAGDRYCTPCRFAASADHIEIHAAAGLRMREGLL